MRALSILLLVVPLAATAAESDSDAGRLLFPPEVELAEDLAVWGAQLPDARRATTTHFTDRIDPDLARVLDLRSLPEAVRLVPGFTHSRDMWGDHRFAARGLRAAPELAVRVDGLLLNDPYDGRAPGAMMLGDGELSAVRGPAESARQALAPLGTVDWTPRPVGRVSGRAWFGSYSDAGLVAAARLQEGALELAGDVGLRFASGQARDVREDLISSSLQRAGQLSDGQPVGTTDDGGVRFDVGMNGTWSPASLGGFKTQLKLRAFQEEKGALVGYFDTAGAGSVLRWMGLVGEVVLSRPLGPFKAEVRISGGRHVAQRRFQIVPAGYVQSGTTFPEGIVQDTEHATQSWGGELTLEGDLFEDNTFLAGLGVGYDRLASFDFQANADKDGKAVPLQTLQGVKFPQQDRDLTRRVNPYFFIEDRWRVAGPFAVQLGLRGDTPSDVSFTKTRCEENLLGACGSGLLASPRLAAGVDVEGVSFWLRYAGDARPPTFYERTAFVGLPRDLANGHPEGNSDLRVVSVQLVEARAGYDTSSAGVRARMWVTGFWERFTDRIETIVDSTTVAFLNRDAGPVTTIGAEAGLRLDLSSRAWQELGLAWSRVTDGGIDEGFNLLTNTPQLSAHFALRAPLGGMLGMGLLVELGSERRNNSRTKLEALHHWDIPGYALVAMSLFSEQGGAWDVQLSVKNALDHDLRDDAFRPDRVKGLIPREGRALALTLRGSL